MSTRASTIRVVAGLVGHLGDEVVESVTVDRDNQCVLYVPTDSISAIGAALLKAWDALNDPTLDESSMTILGQLCVHGSYCGVTVGVVADVYLASEIDTALESGVPIGRELIEAATR